MRRRCASNFCQAGIAVGESPEPVGSPPIDAAAPTRLESPRSELRRLNPATILVELLRRLGSLAYFIVIVLLLRYFGKGGVDWHEWALAAIAVFGASGAAIRYLSLRYGVTRDCLVLRTGIIVRQHRTIPIDRIQNIDLKRGVLHRILGVVDVEIETAGGVEPEARLSVVTEAEARRLKADLLRSPAAAVDVGTARPTGDTQPTPEPPSDPLWRTRTSELLLLGATENRAGVILGGVAGLWYTFGDVSERSFAPLLARLPALSGSEPRSAAIWIAAAVIVLMLAGWIASMAISVITYHGFVLRRSGDRLRRRFGLFTQLETTIPIERTQVVRIEAPLPRRLLGYETVFAENAGSVLTRDLVGTTPLCPIIPIGRTPELMRRMYSLEDLESVRWQKVSRRAIQRGFVRYAALGLGLLIAAALAWKTWLLALSPPILGVAWLAALARYHAIGYAELGEFVLARAGVWTRRVWILPRAKVQSVDATQTPFQRRSGLASLRIATAAGRGGVASPRIVDLPSELAMKMQDRLTRDAACRGYWQLDGV